MNRKKLISLFLVIAVCFSFAACAGGNAPASSNTASASSSNTGSGGEASAYPLYEKSTIWKLLTPRFVNADLTGDLLTFEEMKKVTNVTLEIDAATGGADYYTKLNMMLSTNQLPDMLIAGNITQVSKYFANDTFANLAPYMEKSGKNIMSKIEEDAQTVNNCKTDDGKMFFIPSLAYEVDSTAYMINKPWLDELGLEVPKTTDDLYTVLKAFKAKGEGIVPWSKGQWYDALQEAIFLPYGTFQDFKLFSEDEYLYGPYQKADEMKAALAFLNKCFSEGLIDPEYLTLDNDSYVAKVKNGKVGFVYGYPGQPLWNTDADGKVIEPKVSDWEFMPALTGPTGIREARRQQPIQLLMLVTKNHPDPEKAVQYMDYIFSDAGVTLFNFGVEGDTFEVANGKKTFTEKVLKHEKGPVNGARSMGITPNNFPFYRSSEVNEAVNAVQINQLISDSRPINGLVDPVLSGTSEEEKEFANIMVDVKKTVDEMIPKFIIGELSLENDWDTFLQQQKDFGVERAIEIKQAQFKRWQNR